MAIVQAVLNEISEWTHNRSEKEAFNKAQRKIRDFVKELSDEEKKDLTNPSN